MSNSARFVGLIIAVIVSVAIPSLAFMPEGKSTAIVDRVLPVDDKVFLPAFPGNDKIVFAAAYGDRNTKGHGTFGRFPANFETPPHIHTHAYRAVVIKGVMTNPFKGETELKILKPGSYWEVSAGSIHTTACISDTPCEFYMYGDEAFDFHPAG